MPFHDDGVANRKSFLIAGLQAALIALCIQHAAKLGECLGLEQNDTYSILGRHSRNNSYGVPRKQRPPDAVHVDIVTGKLATCQCWPNRTLRGGMYGACCRGLCAVTVI